MKTKIIIISLITIISACSILKKNIVLNNKDIEYKVCSIDSVSMQFYYHIELLYKNRDTIDVLSLKTKCNYSQNKIKIGQKYKFNLEMIIKYYMKILPNGDTLRRNLVQDAYTNYSLPDYLQKPYITKDLCGLNYLRGH